MKHGYKEFVASRKDTIRPYEEAIEKIVYKRISKEFFSEENDLLSIRDLTSMASRDLQSHGLACFNLNELVREIFEYLAPIAGFEQAEPFSFYHDVHRLIWPTLARYGTYTVEEHDWITGYLIAFLIPPDEEGIRLEEVVDVLCSLDIAGGLPYDLCEEITCKAYDFYLEKGIIRNQKEK